MNLIAVGPMRTFLPDAAKDVSLPELDVLSGSVKGVEVSVLLLSFTTPKQDEACHDDHAGADEAGT